MKEWKDKRVLVVGMARSGLAAAELLLDLGARPVLSDMRGEVEAAAPLVARGAERKLGDPAEALVSGCDAVIISPGVRGDAPVVREARRLHVPVLAELEFAAGLVRGTQVAITGTNGKSTTTALAGEMLRQAGKHTFVAGNIGIPLSTVALEATQEDYTVIEVSSFQLEFAHSFHPKGAALLNLTPDHLDRHGDMETYGALKEGMIQNQTEADFFVYNADDPFCRQVAARAKARTVPFSRRQALKEGAWIENGQFMVQDRALCPVEDLKLPGTHNVENALAAAALAAELLVPAPVIRHALRSFPGIEHRMETVRTVGNVRYINDSKGTNPESSIKAVESMTVPTVLLAGGEDKGTDFQKFAEAVRSSGQIVHVVLIGKTAKTLREALKRAGYNDVTVSGDDFEEAIHTAQSRAVDGGVVLLSPACASFDMFKDFEERGRRFKEIVNLLG